MKVIEVAGDEDWLLPPPKVVFHKTKASGEDSTIKALRLFFFSSSPKARVPLLTPLWFLCCEN